MIQFRRGSTEGWRKFTKPLAEGQPGYDKNKHKIKIGDGESSWSELPYASGLSTEDIINEESEAKVRHNLDPEDGAIITYGTEDPDENTVGQIYLQHYEAEPEADYIVEMGINDIWTYRKWRSGIAECWGTLNVKTVVKSKLSDTLYYNENANITVINYPITFVGENPPLETVTIQSEGPSVWLAGRLFNNSEHTAAYAILSPQEVDSASYNISFNVKGRWK